MKKHPHFVKDLYEKTRFDILCVQETKMQEGNVGEMVAVIEDDEDENDENRGPGGLHNQKQSINGVLFMFNSEERVLGRGHYHSSRCEVYVKTAKGFTNAR